MLINEKEDQGADLKLSDQPGVIKTYAGDMSRTVQTGTQETLKSIIAREQQLEEEKNLLSPEKKQNRLFVLLGILFIVVACVSLYYLMMSQEAPTVVVPVQFTPLIFNDQSQILEIAKLDKDTVIKNFENEVNTATLKNGGIEGVYFTLNGKALGLRKFINLLGLTFVPGDTTYVTDSLLTGFMNTNALNDTTSKNRSFFMLMKVRSMVDVFPSMRTWEKNMFNEMHGFFGIDLTADNAYLATKDFDDGIIQNKNARILHDKDGNIVMLYVFADNNSVLITDSEQTTREIMLRLSQNRTMPQ